MTGLAAVSERPRERISEADITTVSAAGVLPDSGTLVGRRPAPFRALVRTHDGLGLQVEADDPHDWLEPTLRSLADVLSLPPDWDSCGARPVDPDCAFALLRILDTITYASTPAPSVVPTAAGGLQAEWHVHGVDLEIQIESPARASACYEIVADDEEWEGEHLWDLSVIDKPIRLVSGLSR